MAKGRITSKRVAKVASKVLRGKYSKAAKAAAGSALAQRPSKRK